jgi:hypothetical protein
MRVAFLIAFAAVAAGCGSKEAIPAESPTNEQPPSANDPNRRLTKTECVDLGHSVVQACHDRGNDRSAEVDGWCSDMVQRNTDSDAWVTQECVPHFRYMDSYCFGSANNAHGMLDCDKTVDRTR